MMPRQPIVVKTLVTSNLITRIARHFKAQVVDNLLVGFKYIAEVLHQLEEKGTYEEIEGTLDDFILGCEESHGYLVTPHIRDKDSGATSLLLAEMALDCKRGNLPSLSGRGVGGEGTIIAYLQSLERQFGYFRHEVRNIALPGVEGRVLMARMLNHIRQAPPKEIGGLTVTSFDDLQREDGWMGPFKGATDKASRNFMMFTLAPAPSSQGRAEEMEARIALRPSGTEPKAKAYIEVCSAPCPHGLSDADWQKRCAEIDATAKQVADAFLLLCK
jgi:phosphoglucomutase/phosphomannomutase